MSGKIVELADKQSFSRILFIPIPKLVVSGTQLQQEKKEFYFMVMFPRRLPPHLVVISIQMPKVLPVCSSIEPELVEISPGHQ